MGQAGSLSSDFAFLPDGGEMGARIRAFDWSASPIGRPERWPAAVRAALAIILDTPVPMSLWIGKRAEDLIQIYNDAFRPLLAERHPAALGASLRDLWAVSRSRVRRWPRYWPAALSRPASTS